MKRTIAREWLLFLLSLPVGCALCFYWAYYLPSANASPWMHYAFGNFWNAHFGLTGGTAKVLVWLVPYAIFAVVRSIWWSIRILRGR